MSQVGLFDFEERCAQLQALKNPLLKLNEAIRWQQFRPILNKVREKERKAPSGRKAYDAILMFKILILQSLYNLGDDQMEYQIRDRISFMEFLGLRLGDRIPDAKTIWLFKDQLSQRQLTEKLFNRFNGYLEHRGFRAQGGSMIDASIVEVPVQRNSREDNQQIKEGQRPDGFDQHPPKGRQKDTDARWTKKRNTNYFGYKNHINADATHKFIRRYAVTEASEHDSQETKTLLDKRNRNKDVYADSAYRSEEISEMLENNGYRDKIHRKGYRGHSLSERSKVANRKKSKIRARVEHVFGRLDQYGGRLMRCIGKVRAQCWIGLRNLVYNLDRYTRVTT